MLNILDVNNFPGSNLYPKSSAASLGIGASATSAFSGRPSVAIAGTGGMNTPVEAGGALDEHTRNAVEVAGRAKPLPFWFLMVIFTFGFMYLAQRLGGKGDFANIKLTAYNIVIMTFAVIIGMTFMKALFTKFPIPGLSAIVLAA